MVIENQYIQTSLMVALSLFRGKDRGGPIYKSEVGLIVVSRMVRATVTSTKYGWYLVGGLEHEFYFPYIGNVIIPTELIFFRGVGIPPTTIIPKSIKNSMFSDIFIYFPRFSLVYTLDDLLNAKIVYNVYISHNVYIANWKITIWNR